MLSAAVLLLVLCGALPLHAQSCCKVKKVTNSPGNTLDGTYTFKKEATGLDLACVDGCIYSTASSPLDEYCFQRSSSGAQIDDEECDATPAGPATPPSGPETLATTLAGQATPPVGPTTAPAGPTNPPAGPATPPAGPMTTASPAQLKAKAEEAAEGVKRNTAKIAENTEKVAKAEATTAAINNIQDQLTEGVTTPPVGGRVREKREVTNPPATMKPVAKPTDCLAFKATFKELLELAAAVSDENIGQIKVYVDALADVAVKTLCSESERTSFAAETDASANLAKTKTKEFVGKKETENNDLKEKVNELLALQVDVNKQLVGLGEPTIPLQASTYQIEGTKTSQDTTKPLKEETPGATEQPINLKETTPAPTQPPPKISTGRPNRGLFFGRNKRSRGSVF